MWYASQEVGAAALVVLMYQSTTKVIGLANAYIFLPPVLINIKVSCLSPPSWCIWSNLNTDPLLSPHILIQIQHLYWAESVWFLEWFGKISRSDVPQQCGALSNKPCCWCSERRTTFPLPSFPLGLDRVIFVPSPWGMVQKSFIVQGSDLHCRLPQDLQVFIHT